MRNIFLLGLLMIGLNTSAQILNDSTVQFVGYWDLNETQLYRVVHQKYKVSGQDTVSREMISYDSEISIIDSSANGYTVKWTYKNYDFKTDNKFTEKLMKIAEDISIIYTTDDLGVFQEIKNFKEIKSIIDKSIDSLAIEFKDIPNINPILQQVRQTFTTKEAIQSAGINEILYFHSPFGSQYNINLAYSKDTQLPNLYGGNPFDAKVESEIVEVDTVNSTAVVKIFTTVDSEQATEATYEYLKRLSKTTNTPEPKRNDIPLLNIQTRFASNVHMPSGWVLYTVNVKEVTSGEHLNIERTELTLQ